jgi:hypothetical protein
MAFGECIPYYEPGERITVLASTALIAKRLLKLSAAGAKVNGKVLPADHATAPADIILGVCGFDQPDVGYTSVCYAVGNGYVVPLTSGGAIAVGAWVTAGAGGKAVSTATQADAIGRALSVATAADQDVVVRLSVQ